MAPRAYRRKSTGKEFAPRATYPGVPDWAKILGKMPVFVVVPPSTGGGGSTTPTDPGDGGSNPDTPTPTDGSIPVVVYSDPTMAALRASKVPAANTFGVGLPAPATFNVWSEALRDVRDAPLHANSANLVNNVATTQLGFGTTSLNVSQYGHPVYVVRADQPRVAIGFRDEQKLGYTKDNLYNFGKHFLDVPIPPGVAPGVGSDSSITVWCPETDQMWEYWVAKHDSTNPNKVGGVSPADAQAGNYTWKAYDAATSWAGWSATHGGRIDNLSKGNGSFPAPMGVTATGVAAGSTAVSVADVRSGKIEHALSLQLPMPRAGNQVYPAMRTDGWGTSTDVNIPYEGARFRLKTSYNVDSSNLTPVGKMIAKAAQKYGFIVTDKSGVISVAGEEGSGYKLIEGADPWPTLLGGLAGWQVLANFPWNQLEALPYNWGRPGSVDTKAKSLIQYKTSFTNQANSSVLGLGWVANNGFAEGLPVRIVSGVAKMQTSITWGAQAAYSQPLGSVDQFVEMAITGTSTTADHPSAVLRLIQLDSGATSYTNVRYSPSAGAWQIGFTNGGSATITAARPSTDYTLRVEARGATVKIIVNGVVIGTVTDPNPPTAAWWIGWRLNYSSSAAAQSQAIGLTRVDFGDLAAV